MNFPGPYPMHGDTVKIVTDTTSVSITGTITSQGVLREGRGVIELTLLDTDPQQRRDLVWAKHFRYELYGGGRLLYSSPQLKLSGTHRTGDGALMMTGSP
ncbi:hypothetical protein ACIOUE_39905 [Streptomyces xanthochromogenes]|uniref:hypothetical protein n=1 Tax=Streptomyces xanthochromogenes TaxID=67384 RepID=UPI003815FBAC